MSKRKISPHKGGRDAYLPSGRVTKAERNRIDNLIKKSDLSFADWVMEQVEKCEKANSEN